MRTIVLRSDPDRTVYSAVDTSALLESEFEASVLEALTLNYPDYRCIIFGGGFTHNGLSKKPDLALVHRKYSHWFVLEVELLSHSLEKHVLPQMRTIRYGEPQPECLQILSRELGISVLQAATMIRTVPRDVAVIANGESDHWTASLKAIQVQFMSMHCYRSQEGSQAFEISGELSSAIRNVGFGKFDGVVGSIRFPRHLALPSGQIQFEEPGGLTSSWTIEHDGPYTWVTKQNGRSYLHGGAMVQIVQKSDGRFVLRDP